MKQTAEQFLKEKYNIKGEIYSNSHVRDLTEYSKLYNDELLNQRDELLECIKEVIESCGVVNFSSHNQMREAIEVSLNLCEELINRINPNK